MRWLVGLAWVISVGCGAPRAGLPDYSEWMHTGVDPRAEAEAITAGLVRAGYEVHAQIEGETWIAIDARRGDERAIRVVTTRGAALVLDSHETDRVRARHGEVALIAPPRAPSHDLDDDGLDEVVIGATHQGRVCLLPFRIDAEGAVAPVAPELGALGSQQLCVESFRDVDENGRLEAIAVWRVARLARGETPEVEVPLERSERARFELGPPPVRWVEEQRGARARELDEAVAAVDVERVYTLAIELAALGHVAGRDRDAQLEAFDAAIGRVVLTRSLADDVRAARAWIERGWSDVEPEEEASEPDQAPPSD